MFWAVTLTQAWGAFYCFWIIVLYRLGSCLWVKCTDCFKHKHSKDLDCDPQRGLCLFLFNCVLTMQCKSQSWNHLNCASMVVCLHFKNIFFQCNGTSNFPFHFCPAVGMVSNLVSIDYTDYFLFALLSTLIYKLFHSQPSVVCGFNFMFSNSCYNAFI